MMPAIRPARPARDGKARKAEEQGAPFYVAEVVEQTLLQIATGKSALADLFQLEC
jgi:hypothetical protein